MNEQVALQLPGGDMPNVLGVVPDGAVGGKDAGPGDVDEGHPVPGLLVQIGLAGPLMGGTVALKVGQQQVLIGGAAVLTEEEPVGQVGVADAVVEAAGDLVQNCLQGGGAM